jgi:flagellar hook-basal body complex protein FliE
MTNTIGQQAAALYQSTAKIAGGEGKITSGQDDQVSFASLMKAGVEKVIETQKTSEEMSAKAVTGQANITDVVQAVTEAEVTLQTMVAVRDKVIGAYQEIMRMPI